MSRRPGRFGFQTPIGGMLFNRYATFAMLRTLTLIPTPTEFSVMAASLKECERCELCGFGPIAAAARAAQLIEALKPKRVVLLGIAGTYTPMLEVGSAYAFANVASYGVGIGTGSSFRTAETAGWHQWNGSTAETQIGDTIALETDVGLPPSGTLLTVCASSGGSSDNELRLSSCPGAVAEDMEGFGVALACKLANVPLVIVRGISNQAGDRDQSHWKIKPALLAAAELATMSFGG